MDAINAINVDRGIKLESPHSDSNSSCFSTHNPRHFSLPRPPPPPPSHKLHTPSLRVGTFDARHDTKLASTRTATSAVFIDLKTGWNTLDNV